MKIYIRNKTTGLLLSLFIVLTACNGSSEKPSYADSSHRKMELLSKTYWGVFLKAQQKGEVDEKLFLHKINEVGKYEVDHKLAPYIDANDSIDGNRVAFIIEYEDKKGKLWWIINYYDGKLQLVDPLLKKYSEIKSSCKWVNKDATKIDKTP